MQKYILLIYVVRKLSIIVNEDKNIRSNRTYVCVGPANTNAVSKFQIRRVHGCFDCMLYPENKQRIQDFDDSKIAEGPSMLKFIKKKAM